MILKFFKFFLAIIIFFIFIFLVNISFFNSQNKGISLDFIIDQKNNKKLDFQYKINYLDNIFSNSKDNFKVNMKGKNIEVDVFSGSLIVDLNDLTKNYTIKGNGFNIKLSGVGSIFLNLENKKYTIFSLNSSYNLDFLDKDKKIINSFFSYPHEWIRFDPNLNFIYKNSDIYRIRTTTKNGYFSDKLSDILDDNNLEKFKKLIGEKNIDFFKKYISIKKQNFLSNKEKYNKLLSLKYSDFAFKQLILSYKKYFINDNKKLSFLKSEVYNDLIKLYKNDKIDKKTILNISNNLGELKKLNSTEYEKMILYIKGIYKVFLTNNLLKDQSKIENFYMILEKDNFKKIKDYFSFLAIYNGFDLYDRGFSKKDYFLILNNYINNLLKSKDSKKQLESLDFYLNNYISINLFNSINDLKFDNKIFEKYFSLNKKLYFQENNIITKKQASIKKLSSILEKVKYFIRNNFFEEKRDEKTNLLILKDEKVNFDLIIKLKDITNNIFDLFFKNESILEEIDLEDLKNNEKIFKEYFLALNDYKKYKINYNKTFKDFYESSGIGVKEQKKYTKNDIIKYFKNFNGISFDENNIVKKENYFELKDVEILNNKYIFKFYPYLGNKLEIVKNNGNTLIYNLNIIEKQLKEKLKGAKQEDRYKYDFHNFFVQSFKNIKNDNSNNNLEDFCKKQNKIVDLDGKKCISKYDSDEIASFKTNRLLNQEFNIISNFFFVKYENLDIELKDKIYKIYLKNVLSKISVNKNNNKKNYNIIFNSDYDSKNHLFSNIKIRVYESNDKQKLLFDGANIEFIFKKVKIQDLQKFLQNYLENIETLKNIYNTIRGEYIISDLKIKNIVLKNYFKFYINNKKITIKVEKNKIISIMVNNINILNNSININELKNYLYKFK